MSRSAARDGRVEVVVSGLGIVSPYGTGVKSFWNGLAAGTCAIKPITVIETEGFRSRIAAEIPAEVMGTLRASRRRSRADRIALAAAGEALADAGLEGAARREAALLIGAVGGGMLEGENWYWELARGRPSSRLEALRSILPFSHAETLGWRLGLTGPKETVVMACASGAASIALGADLIRAGVTPTALVGGVDALTHICFMGFNALKLLDPTPCRPFDRERRGMSIGEAAAFLVIEDAEHCRARGGRVHARLAGYGMTTDAHHVTAPHPDGEGMIHAMQQALDAAGLDAREVGYVNAHGTGTPQNDRAEALALRRVFGDGRRARQLHQVAGGPHDGGGRQRGGHRDDPRAPARAAAADREPRADGPRRALRLPPRRRASGRGERRAVELVRLRGPERQPHLPEARRP